MNNNVYLASVITGILLLSGCAGTTGDFECNATTSDTCMTIEQANEKAKRLEESSTVKPDVAVLPRLAEGNFRTVSVQPLTPPPVTATTASSAPLSTRSADPSFIRRTPAPTALQTTPAARYQPLPVPVSTREMIIDPRPLRVGEQTAGLWIAPYIDTQDVYHQPGRVFFVVKPAAWGKPRVN
ncbi:type IV conjugative transfer system lipoprotein TraV [Atlantibacter subterraneus]|uniref:type IV conjugative transfer system lipoprotein TraV n=1 Tax=Atlantibacter subterraneus TaxID=255519 RepID=UPI002FDEEA7B